MNENLLDASIAGEKVQVIYEVAKTERVKPASLLKKIASGRVVIMQRYGKQPVGIAKD